MDLTGRLSGRRWKEGLLTQSYSNPLDWKIFKGQSKERWSQEKENKEAWGWDREDRAMKIKCLLCGREMNMDHQAFSNFRGSLKCLNCRGVMEIQTMRGLLIWGYPLSDVNPDFTGRAAERNFYGEQKKI